MEQEQETACLLYNSEERCVMCGDYVPEGRMVCLLCEMKVNEMEPARVPPARKPGLFQRLRGGRL